MIDSTDYFPRYICNMTGSFNYAYLNSQAGPILIIIGKDGVACMVSYFMCYSSDQVFRSNRSHAN